MLYVEEKAQMGIFYFKSLMSNYLNLASVLVLSYTIGYFKIRAGQNSSAFCQLTSKDSQINNNIILKVYHKSQHDWTINTCLFFKSQEGYKYLKKIRYFIYFIIYFLSFKLKLSPIVVRTEVQVQCRAFFQGYFSQV